MGVIQELMFIFCGIISKIGSMTEFMNHTKIKAGFCYFIADSLSDQM